MAQDIRGNPVVRTPTVAENRAMQPEEWHHFLTHAITYHRMWYVLYRDPPADHDALEQRRMEGDEEAILALSRLELSRTVDHMIGLPILHTHAGNDPSEDRQLPNGHRRLTLGVVTDSYQDPHNGTVYVQLRFFDSPEARVTVAQIETGLLRGISLQHIREGQVLQLREVSVCLLGRHPGSRLQYIVEVPTDEPLDAQPWVYKHPDFVVSRASSGSQKFGERYVDLSLPTQVECAEEVQQGIRDRLCQQMRIVREKEDRARCVRTDLLGMLEKQVGTQSMGSKFKKQSIRSRSLSTYSVPKKLDSAQAFVAEEHRLHFSTPSLSNVSQVGMSTQELPVTTTKVAPVVVAAPMEIDAGTVVSKAAATTPVTPATPVADAISTDAEAHTGTKRRRVEDASETIVDGSQASVPDNALSEEDIRKGAEARDVLRKEMLQGLHELVEKNGSMTPELSDFVKNQAERLSRLEAQDQEQTGREYAYAVRAAVGESAAKTLRDRDILTAHAAADQLLNVLTITASENKETCDRLRQEIQTHPDMHMATMQLLGPVISRASAQLVKMQQESASSVSRHVQGLQVPGAAIVSKASADVAEPMSDATPNAAAADPVDAPATPVVAPIEVAAPVEAQRSAEAQSQQVTAAAEQAANKVLSELRQQQLMHQLSSMIHQKNDQTINAKHQEATDQLARALALRSNMGTGSIDNAPSINRNGVHPHAVIQPQAPEQDAARLMQMLQSLMAKEAAPVNRPEPAMQSGPAPVAVRASAFSQPLPQLGGNSLQRNQTAYESASNSTFGKRFQDSLQGRGSFMAQSSGDRAYSAMISK